MSHESYRNRARIIERRLERKQREHHVHGSRDLREPVTPPRPDRRTDEMDGPDPGPAQRKLQREIEVRCVHADERVGRVLAESPGQAPTHRNQLQIAAEHLEQPHDREPLHRVQRLAACRKHSWPRDAFEARARNAVPERPNEAACKHVSGRFAGDDGESQDASPSPPPFIARCLASRISRIRGIGPPRRLHSPVRRAGQSPRRA